MLTESIQIFLPLTAVTITASLLLCGAKKKAPASSEDGSKKTAKSPAKPQKSQKPTKIVADGDRTTDGRSVTGTTGGEKATPGAAAGGLPAGVKAPENGPKTPAAGGMAGTHDPNYQTLAGVGGECFGADKKAADAPAGGAAAPKAPAAGGMAGTHDPNYQTLAGVGGECFGADKKAADAPAGGAAAPKAPAAGGMAGTHDPNYQTLAGVGGECFGADKKK